MERGHFVRGALSLAAAATASRFLGLFYIILLPRIIKDSGYGLFHMVKPIYSFAVVIAVAGMPIAISKLVAEKAALGRRDGVFRVFNTALLVLFVLGLAVSALLMAAAEWIAVHLLHDRGAYYPLLALAPSVLLLSLASAWRGFLQGLQSMEPSAFSQVCEQLVRVLATVGGAVVFLPWGVEMAAAGAAFGSVIGAMAGLLAIVAFYVRHKEQLVASIPDRRPDAESGGAILRRLVAFAFPLVLGSVLWPVMGSLDAAIVPARLRVAGLETEAVRQWYGYLGMAGQLVYFPTVISMALAASLVPAIAEAVANGRRTVLLLRSQEALRVTALLALPAAAGLFALAEPAATVLFGYRQAAVPLRILAFGAVFLAGFQTSTGILHGMGRPMAPFATLLGGALVKTALTYTLTAMPEFGIRGAALGTVIGFAVAAVLNVWVACRSVGIRLAWRPVLLAPAGASAVMAIAVDRGQQWLAAPLGHYWGIGESALAVQAAILIALIPAGALLYALLLALSGALKARDAAYLPRIGLRLQRWMERRGWG